MSGTGGDESPAPKKAEGKADGKGKRNREKSPRPSNLPQTAFRRKIISFEHADIAIAWEKSDWFREQEKENPGRIEEKAIASDDENTAKRAWKAGPVKT